MEKETRYDLKLSGMGNASGGTYNVVSVDGIGKIDGDLDCIDLRINGMADLYGSLKTKTCRINGKASIRGNVDARELRISGHCDIDGNISSKETRIDGHCSIKGGISAEEVEIRGIANINGDCSVEVFTSKGVFTISGLLNAGTIDIELYASSRVREIGGEKINIRHGNTFGIKRIITSIFPSLGLIYGLSTETIEGDDIYLEYTRAKIVRGNNVVLGTGCEIELVEYKSNFEQHSEAKVKESRKV